MIFLFIAGILSVLDIGKASDRRLFTPILLFMACVCMTTGLMDYASWYLINSHSSRSMILAIVFTYTALTMSTFLAGRYRIVENSEYLHDEFHLRMQK
jgi:hypothetical protein